MRKVLRSGDHKVVLGPNEKNVVFGSGEFRVVLEPTENTK